MRNLILTKISDSLLNLISSANIQNIHFLLAVSGGADSVAMLLAMDELRTKFKFGISVITVNHNVRPADESMEDVLFVKDICGKFSPPVRCIIAEIPENKAAGLASKRKKGLEEACRILRYAEFEKACSALNCDFIVTAHTKNDFYETVLMRLFMGAGSSSVLGIAKKHGKYLHPMLEVERCEAESYLRLKKILWREDVTNKSLDYLRNKVRLSLIPVLSGIFGGWQSGLDKTLEKIALDERFVSDSFNSYLKNIPYWQNTEGAFSVFCRFEDFENMPPCFKIRFLQEGFTVLGVKTRVSFHSVKAFLEIGKKHDSVIAGGLVLEKNKDKLILKYANSSLSSEQEDESESGYMVWINSSCSFFCPAGNFHVEEKDGKFFIRHADDTDGMGPFYIPFCVRSRLKGDTIQISRKSKKTIKKLLNELTSDSFKRKIVPIIEEKGRVAAVYGKAAGLKNFYSPSFGGKDEIP